MTVATLPLGPYEANCSILSDGRGGVLVVDPGAESGHLSEVLNEMGLAPSAVFLTHGHFDHISGVDGLVATWKVPVFLHAQDMALAFSPFNLAQPGYGGMSRSPLIDNSLGEGDSLPGWPGARIFHLPGHSPGSCALYFPGESLLVAGDVLFAGSIGRTDLPGGSWDEMENSLRRLSCLPRETRVICGHGPDTTIGREFSR